MLQTIIKFMKLKTRHLLSRQGHKTINVLSAPTATFKFTNRSGNAIVQLSPFYPNSSWNFSSLTLELSTIETWNFHQKHRSQENRETLWHSGLYELSFVYFTEKWFKYSKIRSISRDGEIFNKNYKLVVLTILVVLAFARSIGDVETTGGQSAGRMKIYGRVHPRRWVIESCESPGIDYVATYPSLPLLRLPLATVLILRLFSPSFERASRWKSGKIYLVCSSVSPGVHAATANLCDIFINPAAEQAGRTRRKRVEARVKRQGQERDRDRAG